MIQPARRLFALVAAAIGVLTLGTTSANAQGLFDHPKYAAIVVDAGTGEVLYARRADALRYPASITKVMTLYLTFEALSTGRLSLNDSITMSPHAASQSPTKLGAPAGSAVNVDLAIRAIAVKSSNDVAVAMAEHLGGSESRFAALMTLRAQELGMTNTRFTNASGLPDSRQVSSARDIAILSRAVLRDYPQYYSYFGTKSFTYKGQTIGTHNRLMKTMPGVDGIKTGYTNAAGYNLAASQVKDGRRLITVVMGGSSTAARDENVADLLNAGFDVLSKRKLGQNITIASNISEPDDISGRGLRPSIEQGSADQPGLRIVLSDQINNQVRANQPAPNAIAEAEATAGSRLLSAAIAETSPVDAAMGRQTLRASAKQTAALDCVQPKARKGKKRKPLSAACRQQQLAETKCLKTAKGKTLRARRAVCANRLAKDVELASNTASSTKASCAKAKTRKAKAACAKTEDREEQVAAADTATGKYLIQVGAFKSRGDAQRHLDMISKRYGSVVSSASSQVQSRSGNYRARFQGFSAQEAKQACKQLTSKGQLCMVLSKG